MSARSWLLAMACVAVLVLGYLVLFRAVDPPDSARRAPPARAELAAPGSSAGTTRGPDASAVPSGTASQDVSIAQRPVHPAVPPAADVRLAFAAPARVSPGGSVDLSVTIDAQRALDRVVLDIDYDPQQLRLRSAEEVDYSQRAPSLDNAFSIEVATEGHVTVAIRPSTRTAQGLHAAVVQFEAIASGWTKIRVTDVHATDLSGRALAWTASGQESQVAIE